VCAGRGEAGARSSGVVEKTGNGKLCPRSGYDSGDRPVRRGRFERIRLLATRSSSFAVSPSPDSRVYPLLLIAFSIFVFFFNLGGRTLENKDGFPYAEAAWEILETGDWIILHEFGKIYVHKPPLHFWYIALSYKLFGVRPFAARVPSALFAVAGVVLTFHFARRILRSGKYGFGAAMALLSSYNYLWWGRRTRLDLEFAFFFSLALVFFYLGTETGKRTKKAFLYAGFWIAVGFALMEKGAIAFAVSAVVVPYAILLYRRGEGSSLSLPLFAVSFPLVTLPVLPWVIPLVKHPEFATYWKILTETTIMSRHEGIFYYLPQLAAKWMPATPFLALGVWGAFRFRESFSRPRGLDFVLVWAISFFFLLHFSSTKSHRYLLSIAVPLALLTQWGVLLGSERWPRIFRSGVIWYDRVLLLAASGCLFFPLFAAYHYGDKVLSFVLPAAVLGVVLICARRYLPPAGGVTKIFVSFAVLMLAVELGDVARNRRSSPYLETTRILKREGLGVDSVAFYKCKPGVYGGVAFYLGKFSRSGENWDELIADETIKGIVLPEKEWKKISRGGKLPGSGKKIPEGKTLPLRKRCLLFLKAPSFPSGKGI